MDFLFLKKNFYIFFLKDDFLKDFVYTNFFVVGYLCEKKNCHIYNFDRNRLKTLKAL